MRHGNHTVVHQRLFDTAGDQLLALLLGLAGVAMAGVWLTGQLAGLLFHGAWPDVPISAGLTIAVDLPHHWSDPRQAWPPSARDGLPGPAGFAISALLVLAVAVLLAVAAQRRVGRGREVRGYASREQLERTLSAEAALDKLARLRPGLPAADPEPAEPPRWYRRLGRVSRFRRGPDGGAGGQQRIHEVAVPLGRAAGTRMPLWASIEHAVLMLAPPRQGKTSQVIIPWLHRWPGPALVTSVRRDVALATLTLREQVGRVAVMDLTGAQWPCPLRWTPTSDCESYDRAQQRADVMVTIGKPGADGADSTNAGFFGMTSTNLLAAWLHAAALSGRTMEDVLRWSLDERNDEPIRLLRDEHRATPGVATMLDLIYRSPTETRSNLWATAMTAVAPLLSENARAAFSPPARDSLDITEFLTGCGTLYLIVSETEAGKLAPLIASFVDEVTQTAARLAKASPSDRLDPPLGLILDEAANVAPLPQLPDLMSYAAGFGIFVVTVLQGLAQARKRWGREGADELWDHATIKIALGGLSGDALDAFSALAGEYRETVHSTQLHHQHGVTTQSNLVDRKVIAPHEVRTLREDRREALIIHATTPAVRARMVRHYEGRDARAYRASAREVKRRLREAQSGTASAGARETAPGRAR